MNTETEQEKFWEGQFGDEYINRNRKGIASNLSFFSKTISVNL